MSLTTEELQRAHLRMRRQAIQEGLPVPGIDHPVVRARALRTKADSVAGRSTMSSADLLLAFRFAMSEAEVALRGSNSYQDFEGESREWFWEVFMELERRQVIPATRPDPNAESDVRREAWLRRLNDLGHLYWAVSLPEEAREWAWKQAAEAVRGLRGLATIEDMLYRCERWTESQLRSLEQYTLRW